MYHLNEADSVVLPNGLTTIKASNFMVGSPEVHIPESVTYISSRTFGDAKNFTIYGKKGSEAERIANAKGVTFKEE